MRPTTAIKDNVFDINALIRHGVRSPPGRRE